MPGAPPVRLVSVTEIRATPFCENVIFDPLACSSNCVPAVSAPELYEAPS